MYRVVKPIKVQRFTKIARTLVCLKKWRHHEFGNNISIFGV